MLKSSNSEHNRNKDKEKDNDLNAIEVVESNIAENPEINEDNDSVIEMEDESTMNNKDKNENKDKPQTEIENNKTKAKEICWFWKNRNCKYVNNCKKEHPERCKDMIETGICKKIDVN